MSFVMNDKDAMEQFGLLQFSINKLKTTKKDNEKPSATTKVVRS